MAEDGRGQPLRPAMAKGLPYSVADRSAGRVFRARGAQ